MTSEEQDFHDVGKWLMEHVWEGKMSYAKDGSLKQIRLNCKQSVRHVGDEFMENIMRDILKAPRQ